ncbi:MAG TPA: universal stress protein [Bacteroidia bacterium]|nr:universal stress protein [Bacteroidia bacterium]
MKTILIPTDFSECANNALRFAAFMAKKTGATLNLVHVLDVPAVGPQGSSEGTVDDVPYMIDVLKATKARMKKLLTLPFMKKVEVMQNIEIGNVTESIMKAAQKHKADLLVMGTHGAKGLQEILIGSTAEKVVRNSHIPVITIKDEITEPNVEKIVYATDLSDEFESVFPEVERVAKLLGSRIEVVKVVTRLQFEPTKNTQRMIAKLKRKFKESDFSASVYYDYNKQQGIRRYAHSSKADLIALGTHGRHGLSHFFNGSIAEDLVNHSSLPVLTINLNRPAQEKAEEEKKGEDSDGEMVLKNEPSFNESFYKHQIPAI